MQRGDGKMSVALHHDALDLESYQPLETRARAKDDAWTWCPVLFHHIPRLPDPLVAELSLSSLTHNSLRSSSSSGRFFYALIFFSSVLFSLFFSYFSFFFYSWSLFSTGSYLSHFLDASRPGTRVKPINYRHVYVRASLRVSQSSVLVPPALFISLSVSSLRDEASTTYLSVQYTYGEFQRKWNFFLATFQKFSRSSKICTLFNLCGSYWRRETRFFALSPTNQSLILYFFR